MKNILKSKPVQGIIFTLAMIATATSFDSDAGEIKSPQSICQVMSNYGLQAAHEKISNPEMSEQDSYTMLVYGLAKSDDFNKLDNESKETFVKVLEDVYEYVYGDDEITKENAGKRTYEHCLARTDKAWARIISRAPACQAKGRIYELATQMREKGRTETFARSYLTQEIKDQKNIDIVLDAIKTAYSNQDTPSVNGKRAYEECLRK